MNKEISRGIYGRPLFYAVVLMELIKRADLGELHFDKESSTVEDCIFFYSSDGQLESAKQNRINHV